MKRLSMLLLTSVLALALSSTAALATPINITVDNEGILLNTVGIANGDEYSAAGGANNNPSSNLAFLKTMIGNWNGNDLMPFMPAAGALALNQEWDPGVPDYSGPAGYQYVVFHWGAGNAGGGQVSPGGWHSAYYLGGAAISFDAVPQVGGENVGNFSSARYFGTVSVPDGGMTLSLLGGALVGLGLLRRKIGA